MWRPIKEDEIHLYVDGRLERARSVSVEAYLEANPHELRRVEDYLRINALISALATEIGDTLPPAGETRLRALVRRRFARRERLLIGSAAAAAVLVALALGAAGGALWRGNPAPAAGALAKPNLVDDRAR